MKPTMSKQLCLSATAAILSMAVFVLIAGRGGLHADTADQMAAPGAAGEPYRHAIGIARSSSQA